MRVLSLAMGKGFPMVVGRKINAGKFIGRLVGNLVSLLSFFLFKVLLLKLSRKTY